MNQPQPTGCDHGSFDVAKYQERYRKFSIELDCAPGNPRPGDLIEGVLEGTGLEVSDFDKPVMFFGNWTWVLREDSGKNELFTKNKPTYKSRIENLYHEGWIRYGSW